MCTLSIFPQPSALIITGNRDEMRTRAEPNILHQSQDISYPVDGLAGGTWIGINRFGVAIALLNRYQDPLKTDVVTRGEIIPKLLAAGSFTEVCALCRALPLGQYNPFDLVIAGLEGLLQLQFDGRSGQFIEHDVGKPFFITSSGVDIDHILKTRRTLFESFCQNPAPTTEDILHRLHLHKIPGDDSTSIFMGREKTHTKSICQVKLSKTGSSLDYYTQDLLEQYQANNPLPVKHSSVFNTF